MIQGSTSVRDAKQTNSETETQMVVCKARKNETLLSSGEVLGRTGKFWWLHTILCNANELCL